MDYSMTPRKLDKPEPPRVEFGVWSPGGSPATPHMHGSVLVGYRILNTVLGSGIQPDAASAAERLRVELSAYERRLPTIIQSRISLEDCLYGRTIRRIEIGPFSDRAQLFLDRRKEPLVIQLDQWSYYRTLVKPEITSKAPVLKVLKTRPKIILADKTELLFYPSRTRRMGLAVAYRGIPDWLVKELYE